MFQVPSHVSVDFTQSKGPFVELFSPNDGTLISKIQQATEDDINFLLSSLGEAQKKMKSLKPYERSEILKNVARQVKDWEDFLANLIATEGGKPLKDAKVEVARAIGTLELCAEETLRLTGEVIPMERNASGKDHFAFTLLGPIGPVLSISAFNHPLNLIAHQVGCAVASGCSSILKPAPQTPLCAHFLAKAFYEASLPRECLRVINTTIPLIEKLLSSPEFSYVSFIGSAKVGWEIRKKIAPGTRLALEHGGQAPAIIRKDADLEKAASALIKGAFYHAGQVCISTQIIYVHESIFKNFLSLFCTATKKLKIGPATLPDTDVGPLIRPSEVQRLKEWIQEAVERGAKIELGGEISGNLDQYLSPTILSHVPSTSSIMKKEAFGPVVCVNSYSNEDKLLEELNQNRFIFEAALFTNDLTRAFEIAQEISTMTIVINNHTAFRVDQMPFGGHQESGLGMGGVRYAIEEMSRTKQIILRI